MFLDPNKLDQSTHIEILDSAAHGHLGLDHRFLRAFLDRKAEALPAVLAFAERDRSRDAVDIAPELIGLLRYWKTPEAAGFLVRYIKEDPEDVPDEVIEALVEIGRPALDPLLALYGELDESEAGDVAFVLANLRIRDQRVLQLLIDRLQFDISDSLLLLGIYGDSAAIPALQAVAGSLGKEDAELKKEIAVVEEALAAPQVTGQVSAEGEPFDIWSLYPERADLPIDLLNPDERIELLEHSMESVRRAAAASFFNQELTPGQKSKLLHSAQNDESPAVRARAWESLTSATEDTTVVTAMLDALHRSDLSVEERGGLLVGLAPEADRNEVRAAIAELHEEPAGRAKALEAMWRSMHPSFRDFFAKHLDDADLEVRRGAVWGIGYYGIKSELERIRKLFGEEDLRSDALFAYALAVPTEVSRGRMKGLLTRIEKDAHGLSEMEEELVKAALDERLLLAGKEPFFAQQED
ncbi:MAG: hypothetical protein M3Y57_07490 [Acidobacteriota bacterium]|nr:hypothetical protein [Acidobacteriota bacterium]